MSFSISTVQRFVPTPDRVVLALVFGAAVLFALDSGQAVKSVRFTAAAMVGILPFLLLAVLFAAYAKATGADRTVARVFAGAPAAAVVGASLAGALSPFCSCSVIPLIASMLASGVPLAPVMAFWISSPVMDPEMFFLTAGGIHLEFALAKTAAAAGMGLGSGFATMALQRTGWIDRPLKTLPGCGCGEPSPASAQSERPVWRFWREPERTDGFFREARDNGLFLGKWMLLAFFVESLMLAYIPEQWVASAVGRGNAWAVPVATLVGIPAYLNGYAAIPMVSGLLQSGMAPGAAMAFATSGAVASIPAAMAVYAVVRRSVFAVYVVLGLAGSMAAGWLYQLSGLW